MVRGCGSYATATGGPWLLRLLGSNRCGGSHQGGWLGSQPRSQHLIEPPIIANFNAAAVAGMPPRLAADLHSL